MFKTKKFIINSIVNIYLPNLQFALPQFHILYTVSGGI